jgi:hypothetical protein
MGKCYNSITIEAPLDKVWAAISHFYDFSWAPGVVTDVKVVGGRQHDPVGAQRVLNGVFHETLLSLDNLNKKLSYSIDDGPGAVARDAVRNYIGKVSVSPITADNGTFVEWESSYDSADDDAVGELCNPIYQALLSALRQHFSA